MKTSQIAGLTIAGFIAVFATAAYISLPHDVAEENDDKRSAAGPGVLARNYDDDTILVGSVEHVFVGRVIRPTGNEPRIGHPHSQFEVEVVYNIKKELHGTVVVDQDDWFTTDEDRFKAGNTYLIAAGHKPSSGPYYYVGGYTAFVDLIADNSGMSTQELRAYVVKNARVQALLKAYPHENLYERDVELGYTQNSFESLTAEEKQAVYARIENLPPADN